MFDIPFLSFGKNAAVEKKVLSKVEEELPMLVQKAIGDQIHELVMDKIKLNGVIQDKSASALNPTSYVMKVGTKIIDQKEFLQKLNIFSQRPEIAKLPREDQKSALVEELKKHYAVINDAMDRDFDNRQAYKELLANTGGKIFLSEILKREISKLTAKDIQDYYEQNKSLYEQGVVLGLQFIKAKQAAPLETITTKQKFLDSKLTKTVWSNKPETEVPYHYLKALRSIDKDALSPIIRDGNEFVLLLKTENPRTVYTPLSQAAPFIQELLTYRTLTDFLSKITNPLKFERKIEYTDQGTLLDGKPVSEQAFNESKQILPPKYLSRLGSEKSGIDELKLQLDLLFQKFNENPLYFSEELRNLVQTKLQQHKEAFLINAIQQEISSKIKVSDEVIKMFYEQNKDKFVQSVGQMARHIFVKNRSRALEVLNLALMDPANFTTLAKQHSEEERTNKLGGDMRYLQKQDITDEMNKIAQSMKPGEVHPSLIKSAKNDGWHILKYEKNIAKQSATFEEVKPKIHQMLRAERTKQEFAIYLKEVLNKYPSQIDNTLLSQI
jgi:hypothetical protein